jgi:serine/threonine protein kinase
VDDALQELHGFISSDDPRRDEPVDVMRQAGSTLLQFLQFKIQSLQAFTDKVEWAQRCLAFHTESIGSVYPPSTRNLVKLKSELDDLDEDIDMLSLQIKHGARKGRDVSELEVRAEELRAKKRNEKLCYKLAEERIRLYSFLNSHFPELLAEGSEWASSVGVAVGDVALDAWSRGLYVDHMNMQDFDSCELLSSGSGQGRRRVYKAVDGQGQSWALTEFDLIDELEMRHFFRQIALISSLKHPNIADVRAVFREGRHNFFIQMPWYAGGDLAQWIQGDRQVHQCKQVLLDAIHGLAHLHSKDHVHCDVKPANVFLTKGGRALLGDFDGVRNVDASLSSSLSCLLSPVTQRYLAPELKHTRMLSKETDMYSLGGTMEQVFSCLELDEGDEKGLQIIVAALESDGRADRTSAEALAQDPFFSNSAPERRSQCLICFEVTPAADGMECSSNHFLCSICFDVFISSQSANPYVLAECGGSLECPMRPCPCLFFPQDVAVHASPGVHETYTTALSKGIEAATEARMASHFESRLDQLRQEILERTLQYMEVDRHLFHIVESPNGACRQAFVGFTGCFALECSRCGTGFCAWCLAVHKVHTCTSGTANKS